MPDLPSFLFGSILTISTSDLWLLSAVTVLVALVFLLLYRTIISIAFDATFAQSQRLPVHAVEYLLMALIAMTIVSTLRMVGIVLAISMLTIPQMTANLFTYRFGHIIFLSIIIGWVNCLMGLMLSYWLNVPSGAAIIFSAIIIYMLLWAIKSLVFKFK